MNNSNYLIIISGVLLIVLIVIERLIMKYIGNKLSIYAFSIRFDDYARLRNKWYTVYLFNSFNLSFLDLNVAIFKGNIKQIEECFESFDKMKMSKKQKETVYSRAFYYYLMKKEKEKTTRYYHLLKDLDKPEIMKDINIFYNTFIEGGCDYLDEVLDGYKNCHKDQRADFESILSRIYENMNDLNNAQKYKQMAEEHFNLLERERLSKNAKES